jgi:hypothetical protein
MRRGAHTGRGAHCVHKIFFQVGRGENDTLGCTHIKKLISKNMVDYSKFSKSNSKRLFKNQ